MSIAYSMLKAHLQFSTRSIKFGFMHAVIDRPMMRLRTSPIPIGFTPWFVSKAINLQVLYAVRHSGSSFSVQILTAICAMVLPNSADEVLKTVSRFLHSSSLDQTDRGFHGFWKLRWLRDMAVLLRTFLLQGKMTSLFRRFVGAPIKTANPFFSRTFSNFYSRQKQQLSLKI